MYISPDDERSDLFLAAAVYLLGDQVLSILLRRIPLPAAAAPVVRVVLVVVTTILVPLLLIRYRKQRLAEFGFDSSVTALGAGFVASLPLVVAYLLTALTSGTAPLDVLPVTIAVLHGTYVDILVQIVAGVCAVLLAIYTTVKARSAFRADPAYVRPTMVFLARWAAIAAAAASGLLFLTLVMRGGGLASALEVLLVPLGVAGSGYVVYRGVRGSQLTSRATLLTPMVLFAVSSFVLLAPAFEFVFGLWRAALLAGIGLIVGTLLESRRSAWAPLGFAAGLTLLTPLLL